MESNTETNNTQTQNENIPREVIIVKSTHPSDLELILTSNNVCHIDNSLLAQFNSTSPQKDTLETPDSLLITFKTPAQPIYDLKSWPRLQDLFYRSFVFYTIKSAIKHRNAISDALAKFFLTLLKPAQETRDLEYQQYSLLVAAAKAQLLTKSESTLLGPLMNKNYFFAWATTLKILLDEVQLLNEGSFGLICEQRGFKTDFLKHKMNKRSDSKFVSPIATSINTLLIGSKFGINSADSEVASMIDTMSVVKTHSKELIRDILEECNSEEIDVNEESKTHEGVANLYNVKPENYYEIHTTNLKNALLSLVKSNASLLSKVNPNSEAVSKTSQEILNKLSETCKCPLSAAETLTKVLQLQIYYANQEISKTQNAVGQLGKGTQDLYKHLKDMNLEGIAKIYSSFCDNSAALLISKLTAKKEEKKKPKIPKGTRDMDPYQMAVKGWAKQEISEIYKRHGAEEIDTPVFELKETLMGKYGEEGSKLIYDLVDQGGELLSLRYDLTVPFARYLAMNGIKNMRRFHIGKVYRRDQPQMNRGRFREFYQCDFDIAGDYSTMLPDAECIAIMEEIFKALNIGEITIKVNHRKLLDAMVQISGAPTQKFKAICSAVDKLDKEPWDAVKKELIEEKGLTEEMANKIGELVLLKGKPKELLQELVEKKIFQGCEKGETALKELQILFDLIGGMSCDYCVEFDLSLARGLDYYTGPIFEVVLKGANVGSIAGGGRYDELVGMFSTHQIPAVGFSIGIERIFNILEEKFKSDPTFKSSEVNVMVVAEQGIVVDRFQYVKELWNAGIAAMTPMTNPKLDKQIEKAAKEEIPFVVIIKESETKEGKVSVKKLFNNREQITLERNKLTSDLKERIRQYKVDLKAGNVNFALSN